MWKIIQTSQQWPTSNVWKQWQRAELDPKGRNYGKRREWCQRLRYPNGRLWCQIMISNIQLPKIKIGHFETITCIRITEADNIWDSFFKGKRLPTKATHETPIKIASSYPHKWSTSEYRNHSAHFYSLWAWHFVGRSTGQTAEPPVPDKHVAN